MLTPNSPIVKDVVLVGAGHAHVQVLKLFGMKPMPGVRLTLITSDAHTPYSGMLPGLIAGFYQFDDAHIDTGPLCRFASARLYRSTATGLDLVAKKVICDNRPPVPYDILSIDTGSTPNTGGVPGAAERAIPVKPIGGFLAHFEALLRRVLDAGGRRRIAVVGGGAGGVELLLSMERRLRGELRREGRDPDALHFTLITGDARILTGFPERFAQRFEAVFAERGIAIRSGAPVTAVDSGVLHLGEARSILADDILWVTQAKAPDWLKSTGLRLSDKGFLAVDAYLRAEGVEDIFAAGDVIDFGPRPLPKSGVYAVRAGPVLDANIRRRLTGRSLKVYKPQAKAMYLVSTGERYAVGARNGFTFTGEWVWRWKDWIDRRFMDRFNTLPEVASAETPAASPLADREALAAIAHIPMRCGGCGAKVDPAVLSRALAGLVTATRPEILAGLDTPDDAAIMDLGGPNLTAQSVDYCRATIDDPYLFGRIAANQALGDIFAIGGEAQTALAIATLPYGIEAKVEADLAALMAGANETLRQAGCTLVGCHSSEGADLALGFAVTGSVPRQALLRKGGARPGDRLILTKPIGTGTLLAANMRGKAQARWIAAAVDQMLQSSRDAARIMIRAEASAATDITGFGLLGHLLEMLAASGAGAHLDLDRLPVLDGAAETIAGGIVCSLQPRNPRARRGLSAHDGLTRHPLFPLLSDPQTAGGLLAAVPAGKAAGCLKELREAGYRDAALIGEVTPAGDALVPVKLTAGGPSH